MAHTKRVIGLILAAGMGKRLLPLTQDTPKALVKVGGLSLLEWTRHFLKSAGIREIAVVGGYHFADLASAARKTEPSALFVRNDAYEQQNAVSLLCALNELPSDADVLITDVDFIRPVVLAKEFRVPAEFTYFASLGAKADTDEMRLEMENGFLKTLSKTLSEYDGIAAGMFFLPAEERAIYVQALQNVIERIGPEAARIEDALLEALKLGSKVRVGDVGSRDWYEVDTCEERDIAERSVSSRKHEFNYLIGEAGLEAVRCPICQSDDTALLDERLLASGVMRNVQCLRCGHVYLNPRASSDVYDAYYRSGFSEEFNAIDSEEDHRIAESARAKTARIMKFLEPDLSEGLRVLEIGSGYGNLLAAIRDRYRAEVRGIEPDPVGRRVAQNVFKLSLESGTLEDFLKVHSDEKYDFILMHHVLEHMLDPDQAGRALQILLAEGGRIYIGVPNISAIAFPKKLFFRFPHVSNYSPYTLFLFLLKHGFKIIRNASLAKPLSVVVARVQDRADMVQADSFVGKSLPTSKIRRSIEWRSAYHTLRLFMKRHRGKLMPTFVKVYLKSLFAAKS